MGIIKMLIQKDLYVDYKLVDFVNRCFQDFEKEHYNYDMPYNEANYWVNLIIISETRVLLVFKDKDIYKGIAIFLIEYDPITKEKYLEGKIVYILPEFRHKFNYFNYGLSVLNNHEEFKNMDKMMHIKDIESIKKWQGRNFDVSHIVIKYKS